MHDETALPGRARSCGLIAVAVLLTACSGGGGRGAAPPPPPPPPVVLQPQTITFEGGGGVFERRLDQGDFTKVATGFSGTGPITYASANLQVATVNSTTGAITLIGAGEAGITATIAADPRFSSAMSTYLLQVPRPEGIPFDALIGHSDADVTFPGWSRGHEFLRSTQPDCNVTQFTSCADNQVNALTATQRQVVDTSATVARNALWWLRRPGTPAAPLSLSHEKFYARSGPALAGFQGKLWLVGGHQAHDTLAADVWNSPDGVFWTRVTLDGGFPPRTRSRLLTFNDRLWLIGGNGAKPGEHDVWLDDVWSSADGVTWREETANASFGGRYDHGAAVFNDRMWVIGGAVDAATPRANDVWSSTNGVDWTAANHTAAFSARSGHTVTAMNGRLWLVAGDDGTLLDDVWSSPDGVTWTRATDNPGFTPRARHAAAAIAGQLCVSGGMVSAPRITGEIWCTTDGASWTGQYGRGFARNYDMGSTLLGSRWYFAGGELEPGTALPQGGTEYFYTDDVHSWDGIQFRRHTPYARTITGTPALLTVNDRLYAIGHHEPGSAQPYTYGSDDGSHWDVVPETIGSQPGERVGGGYAVHDGKLWVVGGGFPLVDDVVPVVALPDVWNSPDGGDWDAVSYNRIRARYGHALVTFNGKLVVIGGQDGIFYLNDVTTSSDGLTWTTVAANAAFSPRTGHKVVVFHGRMWLYGGVGATGRRRDAWSSDDGITWRLESSSMPTVDYEGFSAVVHDGRVWLMGGRYYEPAFGGYAYQSEIHASTDGVNFTRVDVMPRIFSPRSHAGFVSARGKLWVIGGRDRFSQRSDVWSSADGINWRVHVSGLMPYPMP